MSLEYFRETFEVREDLDITISVTRAEHGKGRSSVVIDGEAPMRYRTILTAYHSFDLTNRNRQPPFHNKYMEFFEGWFGNRNSNIRNKRLFMTLRMPLNTEQECAVAEYAQEKTGFQEQNADTTLERRTIRVAPFDTGLVACRKSTRTNGRKVIKLSAILGEGNFAKFFTLYAAQRGQSGHIDGRASVERAPSGPVLLSLRKLPVRTADRSDFVGRVPKGVRLDELMLVVTTLVLRYGYLTGSWGSRHDTSSEMIEQSRDDELGRQSGEADQKRRECSPPHVSLEQKLLAAIGEDD